MPTPAIEPETTDNAVVAEPYEDDLSYIEAELGWVDTRCRRLITEQMIKGTQLPVEDEGYRRSDADPGALQQRHLQLQATEQQLRREIDARVMASKAAGMTPALVRMKDVWELSDLERTTLLLALGAQLRPEFDDHFRRLGESAYLSTQSIFEFVELSLRERVQERHRFMEGCALVALGLVEVRAGDPDPSMEDVLNAMVVLTNKGFSLLMGEVKMDTEAKEEAEPEVEQEPEHRRRGRVRDEEDERETSLAIPELRLSDVVVNDHLGQQLEEIVAAAQGRRELLHRWGLGRHIPYGRGVNVLFHGPPGTGKSFAAQAIAGQLGRPLLEAAAPDLISKWVGDTQKAFAGLFAQARGENAVLLLDEADAFLSERGAFGAHRHDDGMVNHLLQLLEKHEGVVVMASNLRERLDPALCRRLAYQLHFREPGPGERARIWELMIPETVPTEGVLDFISLGERYSLTGGLIKNCILKASYRAARTGASLSMALLVAAAAEEVAAQAGATESSRVRVVGFSRSGG